MSILDTINTINNAHNVSDDAGPRRVDSAPPPARAR